MWTDNSHELMVEQQIRAWDVLDERVLDILRSIPRERFVPEAQRYRAFADVDVPLPHGQHMLRPNVVGRLLQSLELTGRERVLEVGAGSGYVTACLAATAGEIRSLEIVPELAALAQVNLAAAGIRNAEIVAADAMTLDADAGRYDAMALTGSLPIYDERFQRQLQVGGRLFVVVGTAPIMEARLVRRTAEDRWTSASLFETVVDPLINARRPQEFNF